MERPTLPLTLGKRKYILIVYFGKVGLLEVPYDEHTCRLQFSVLETNNNNSPPISAGEHLFERKRKTTTEFRVGMSVMALTDFGIRREKRIIKKPFSPQPLDYSPSVINGT